MKKSVVVVLVLLLLSSSLVMAVSDTCGFWCRLFGGNVVGEAE